MASYLPSTDSGLAAWALNFATLITATPAAFGLVAGDAVDITTAQTAFAAALVTATDPATRTSATIAAKDSAKIALLEVVRPYAVQISLDSGVTNENKVAVGVTVRSTTPTPIPAPVVAPAIQLVKAIPLEQQLQVRQVGSTSKAKPQGCIGIEIARSVGTVAATDPAQLTIIGTYGKTPLLQSFLAEDQGKVVTYAARYVTRSGPGGVAQKGPWSALLSVTVM